MINEQETLNEQEQLNQEPPQEPVEETKHKGRKGLWLKSDVTSSSDIDDSADQTDGYVISSDEDELDVDTVVTTAEPEVTQKTTPNSFSRIFKFAIVGSMTGLLALGSFTLFMYIYDTALAYPDYRHIAVFASEYISVLFSCLLSFMLNSKFTFSDRKARRAGMALYVLYYVIATGLGALLIYALDQRGLDLTLAKLIKMTINVVLDFLYCRFFIFRILKNKYNVPIEELKEETHQD